MAILIEMKSPVDFTFKGKTERFRTGKVYSVDDDVASHPFMKRFIKSTQAVPSPEPVKSTRRKTRKKAEQ